MAVDITERKAAEERLRVSELFYRQTLESIPGMVFTTRPDGYCDYQSRQWEVYTGVPMSEHLGAGWNRLLHPEDQPRVLAAWEAAVAGRAPYNLEYRVRRHDGGYEWFRVIGQPIHDAEGNIVRWFGVATNIHESKQAEEQLREALAKAEQGEQLLTALLEYLPMGITIADAPDVTIRAVSRYGRLLTGQPREQIQNIPVDLHAQRWQVYRSDGVNLATNEELPLTRATQRGEIVLEEEFVLRRPDGVSVPILCSAAPIRDASGKITGGVIGWQDITERKRMETELRNWAATLERRVAERTAELTASNTELESFTYTVAHDLRAPVRHVLGFIEMLRRTAAGKLEPLENEHLDRIRNAAKRMEELVDGLLEFAQLGRRELVRRPVALSELVAEVRHQLEPETHGRQVEWRISALPTVEGDERLLRQVFYNLLHNAVKFTRPRPEAVIEVGVLDPRTTAEPHPPLAPDAVVLFVRDNGVGFDMRYANKLFGVFQRLHDQREFEGTGIGLAHVQRILQRHGGRVWAKSQPGSGTTIWFTLPTAGEDLKH
jgi:PAS domain S-box-containing protein